MKDFIAYNIESKLDQEEIYNKATVVLPDYVWRKGDSDSQGKYISGRDQNDVTIKIWLGEPPVEISVSFRSAWEGLNERDSKKQLIIDLIETKFIPKIGDNLNKAEFL